MEGLFETLSNKFISQHNKTIKSLQYCRLTRQNSENAGKLEGRLRITATECNYQEIDRLLKEQFIHGCNDNYTLLEIILELTAIRDTNTITSNLVLLLARWVQPKGHKPQFLTI